MLACLSCAPDAFPSRDPFFSTKQRFGSQPALILLKNCTEFRQLKQIHAKIIRNGLSHDQLLARKMIHISSSCGKLDYAVLIFHQIHNPLTFSWNFMIRAFAINGSSKQALLFYNLMICQGVQPDKFTFPFVIKACTESSDIDKGEEVLGTAIKCGFYGDIFLQNNLINLYFKCGKFSCGRKVFDKMRVRNVVSWTTLIAGLVDSEELDASREVFEKMPVRNVISWTTMIDGYAKKQRIQEAFELFWRMQLENVRPNEYTLVSLLKACTELGSLKLGSWIHEFAAKNGFELGAFLGTALIDMYSKCGSLKDARQVFDNMPSRNLATWNAMITSLGVHGCAEEALALFGELEKANIQPDEITFAGVLCAAVHINDLKEGYGYFRRMIERYGIMPNEEHYTCMIELYRRANMLDQISESMKVLPVRETNDMDVSLQRESKIS